MKITPLSSVPFMMGALALAVLAAGCGGGTALVSPTDLSGAPDLGSPADLVVGPDMTKLYAIKTTIALTDDGMGVSLFTQNGSMVHVPAKDILGKSFFFATAAGGQSIANAKMIDVGTGTMTGLKVSFATAAHYGNGPWELGLFLSITAGDPTKGPQNGDLAAFDLSPPPVGQPKVTGTSVRVTVAGADAEVTLDNMKFIRF